MSIDDESLYLYNITLRNPSSYSGSVLGQFLGDKKSQEIVVISSSIIQLLKPNSNTGKIEILSQQNALSGISKIDKLRIVGTQKDLLVVTSDSGNLVILEYKEDYQFIPIIQIPVTKSGFSRINPGEYLLVDPQSRCILIGAIEKNKLIYRLETDENGKIILSNPLEASTKQLLTITMVALDTEYENPLFAAIECDYGTVNNSSLELNYYELDQGLNHIVKRKSKIQIPSSTCHLIPLPNHIGGLLICCENYMIYTNPNKNASPLYLPIPIRSNSIENCSLIVNHVLHKLKKNNFFILLQNTLGDLFKLSVDYNPDKEIIESINITYFDTIPPSLSLNILKSGFLFANVINNDKLFYQFEKLGEDSSDLTLYSTDYKDEQSVLKVEKSTIIFKLRGLDNLALVDILDTLSPLIDSSLVEVKSDKSPDPIKQLITLSSHSYLKTLIHGIPISVLVTSPLPVIPTDVFTAKLFYDSPNDEYLVITSTLSCKTLILSIGEVVEEVEESGFITDQVTIGVHQVGLSSLIQVYSNGIKHIKHIKKFNDDGEEIITKKLTDWFPPAGITILKSSINNYQVVIGLSNSQIHYFEIDSSDDQLIEYQDTLETSSPITCLAISKSSNSKKSSFAIIGCSDETIQVISLLSHNCLEILSLQALSSNSSSLLLIESEVHIGMENGLYVRTLIDEISGTLSNTRTKYLGSKPVILSTIVLPNITQSVAVLAISSKPWICYNYKGSYKVTPLLGSIITRGTSFISEDIGGEGVVAIGGNDLIIFTIGKEDTVFDLNQDFNLSKLKLRYLPRKLVADNSKSKSNIVYIAESEYGIKSPYPSFENDDINVNEEIDEDYYEAFGYEPSVGGWASCVQVVKLSNDQDHEQEMLQSIEFSNTEAILSITQVKFDTNTNSNNSEYIIVGTCTNQKYLPLSYDTNHLYTFKIDRKSNKLQFIHKTEVDYQPTVMIPFGNKLLVAMGKFLRLYDLGQKQLLRKSSTNIDYLTNIIKLIHQGGNRIVIGDGNNSIVFAKFDIDENKFIPFADDTRKRQIISLTTLDYDTVIAGDKFGNIFVLRINESISKQSDEDWNLLKYKDDYLNGSGSRLKCISEIYIADTITCLIRGTISGGGGGSGGGQDSIIYTGLQGSIGVLMPLATKQEVVFLQKLEIILRKYYDSNGYNLLGREHLKFRSYYNPVKNVIDGDLIEKYHELSAGIQIQISRELDRSPKDIEKKIAELRSRTAF
ncbi:CPSF A subunit region-domain-containing protein [Scheffersomyces amazonensis]|uniref:CPSF A subunit region-domain-containing protein n=1 Tax=Scheffersomyces amazonensis TaxID=1078765 RepID=UPI00315DF64C